MCAGHSVGKALLTEHLREDPDQTKKGIEIIADSLMTFVKGCVAVGVDGFYHSTQGGETHRFEGSPIFDECIKPYDLALMEEIERNCIFNILHICDYEGGYTDLTSFLDYPGHMVNASLQLGEQTIAPKDVFDMFGRPFLGGLDRHGIIATGDQDEVRDAAHFVCQHAPDNFVLGADCTLPGDINWMSIKTAIDTAHQFQR
jgi:uroporphyrinogen decarboxylase